jgi:hypothetical protein
LLTNAQCKSSASYDKTRFSKTSPLLLLLEKAKKKEGEKCLRTIDYAILLCLHFLFLCLVVGIFGVLMAKYIYIAVKVWINKYRLTLIGHLKTKIAYSQIGRVDITINPSS